MNDDFSNSSSIDTELQVRLMNLVMGEASDFERDQLQLLMEQRPEVAAYFQHLEHLHGLLSDVGAGEPSMEIDATNQEEAWHLPAVRREKVLAVLDGTDQKGQAKVMLASSMFAKQKSVWSRSWATAVVLVSAASVLLVLMFFPSVQSARIVARKSDVEMTGGTSTTFDIGELTPSSTIASSVIPDSVAATNQSAPRPDVRFIQPSAPDVASSESTYYGRFDAGAVEYAKSPGAQNGQSSENAPSARISGPVGLASPAGDGISSKGDSQARVSRLKSMLGYSGNTQEELAAMAAGMAADSAGEKEFADQRKGYAQSGDEDREKNALRLPKYLMDSVHLRNVEIDRARKMEAEIAGKNHDSSKVDGRDRIARGDGQPSSMNGKSAISDVEGFSGDGGKENGRDSGSQADGAGRAQNQLEADHGLGTADSIVLLTDGAAINPQSDYDFRARNFSSQSQSSKAAGTAKPSESSIGNGQDNSLSSAVELPNPEVTAWDSVAVPTVSAFGGDPSYTVNVPGEEAGGKILLGGILKTGETRQGDRLDDNSNGVVGRETRNTAEQQVASLVETYNDLIDKHSYAEAEVVAKQVGEIDPNSLTSRLLNANARNARNSMEYEKTKTRKEDGFIKALNDVDRAATPVTDPNSIGFPDASKSSSTWMQTVTPRIIIQDEEEVKYDDKSKHFRQAPPADGQPRPVSGSDGSVPTVADFLAESGREGLPQTNVLGSDSLMNSIQQTIDPDSWLEAGETNTRNDYPATLSAVVSAPANDVQALKPEKSGQSDGKGSSGKGSDGKGSDKYFEASKDVAPEISKQQTEFELKKRSQTEDPKSGSSREQGMKNGLFGDVQIDFIEEIDEVIIRGRQQDVDGTMKVIEQIKESAVDKKSREWSSDSKGKPSDSSEQTGEQITSTNQSGQESVRLSTSPAASTPSPTTDFELSLNQGSFGSAVPAFGNFDAGSGNAATKPGPGELAESLSSRLAPSGTNELQLGNSRQYKQSAKDSAPEAGKDGKERDARGKSLLSSPEVSLRIDPKIAELNGSLEKGRSELSKEQAARRSALAPSPEIASNTRGQNSLEGRPVAPKRAEAIDEQTASKEAFSTFSLHVSDVSFKLAQTLLSQGQWPEAAKIRIEEFVNALDYHDPLPSGNQKVACRVEQAIHPFLMQRNLLRVSMRTAATGRSQNTPLRLTILLDNSGSMERPDRRQAVLRAFQTLTQQLSATDQVTLISFASTPRLLADKVPGNQGETLLQIIENLPSEGGTNIEAALLLAREKATEQQVAGAQNRIVLLTDGAVNLGNANPESLARLVTQMRDAGIAFDAAGISAQDLNDEVLEALTRQGDGRYYLLDSAESVGESFAAQIAGALRPSAQNVKVQVEFNPQRVGRYKLLGFEKHRLNKEDFRNDKVDAAEMAAAEAGVAVYQFEIKPNGSGDVGSVAVRFRDLSTGKMVERRWPIPYESNPPRLEQAEPSMQLAASAALFAAKLSGGALADGVDLEQLEKILAKVPEQCAGQPRVQQLRAMIGQAKAIGK